MAKKQTLGTAAGPQRLTDYKRARLCAEWSRLEDERLDLQAQMYERGKQCQAIERQLAEQLDVDGVTLVDLARYQFGRELVRGTMYYKQALIDELGLEEFERRQAAVPAKQKFFLRDKGLAKRARRKAA